MPPACAPYVSFELQFQACCHVPCHDSHELTLWNFKCLINFFLQKFALAIMTFHSNIKVTKRVYVWTCKTEKERIDEADCGDLHENVSH